MKILIVYPEHKKTIWNPTQFVELFSSKSAFPPKSMLLTSILLPINWERKLVNLNVQKLKKRDVLWADYVFIHASQKQSESALQTIKLCRANHKKIVGSGNLFTEYSESFEHIDHLVLDDLRISLPQFVCDFENGKPKKIYHSNPYFEIRRQSDSYYSLSTISDGFSRNIQLSYE